MFETGIINGVKVVLKKTFVGMSMVHLLKMLTYVTIPREIGFENAV